MATHHTPYMNRDHTIAMEAVNDNGVRLSNNEVQEMEPMINGQLQSYFAMVTGFKPVSMGISPIFVKVDAASAQKFFVDQDVVELKIAWITLKVDTPFEDLKDPTNTISHLSNNHSDCIVMCFATTQFHFDE